MEQKHWRLKLLTSLTFWWILLTGIYFVPFYLLVPLGGYVSGIVTLFVPIGIGNFTASVVGRVSDSPFEYPWIITFPLVLITIFVGEYILHKINPKPIVRFFLIFAILFLLTIAVDLVLWQKWVSFEILKDPESHRFRCC